MKKSLIPAAVALSVLAACTEKSSESWQKAIEDFNAFEEELMADTTLTDTQLDSLYFTRCDEIYRNHPDDSAGMMMFKTLVTNWWDKDAALSEWESASELIRGDELIGIKIESLKNIEATQPGKPYIDISGTDILTGLPLSISSMLALGKPVIVDFWASWCPPCKAEIKNHLVGLAKTGEYSILGIAVWEDSEEDTKGMMKTLGVSWPVMYTGGRTGSPSIQYGVTGIPTMILISTDGTIISRGHSLEAILEQ